MSGTVCLKVRNRRSQIWIHGVPRFCLIRSWLFKQSLEMIIYKLTPKNNNIRIKTKYWFQPRKRTKVHTLIKVLLLRVSLKIPTLVTQPHLIFDKYIHFFGTIIMAVGLVQELNIALIFQMCWPFTASQSASERNSVKSHSCLEPKKWSHLLFFPTGKNVIPIKLYVVRVAGHK